MWNVYGTSLSERTGISHTEIRQAKRVSLVRQSTPLQDTRKGNLERPLFSIT